VTGQPWSTGAAIRQTLRHAPIAAADGRFDQSTGSGPVLKPGVCREFMLDQGFDGAWFAEFHRFVGIAE
jgi:hypothetical protein